MPILSFDADNRHNSLDYFIHCTHVERDDNELHKQCYTPYNIMQTHRRFGFRGGGGVSKVSGNPLPFYLMHCPCGVRAWMAELAVIIPHLN